jgi:uncharacterized membrane protein
MSTTAKIVLGLIALMVLLPVLTHWLNELQLPVAVLVVLLLIARVVWWLTRL